jgi:transcriptional regulator with XRE-family HTH domain
MVGARRYRRTAQIASCFPLISVSTLTDMPKSAPDTIERSPFGERLYLARKHAGLSQRDLADKVGLSQSNINGLEKSGQGSAKSSRIAQVCGVRVEWLAEGEGPMLDTQAEVPGAARRVASEKVAHYLVGTPAGNDYRTVALSLAAALEESGTEISLTQFIKLLEATYSNLKR